jgi:hypothetical protein
VSEEEDQFARVHTRNGRGASRVPSCSMAGIRADEMSERGRLREAAPAAKRPPFELPLSRSFMASSASCRVARGIGSYDAWTMHHTRFANASSQNGERSQPRSEARCRGGDGGQAHLVEDVLVVLVQVRFVLVVPALN